jgi:hypothetical protein
MAHQTCQPIISVRWLVHLRDMKARQARELITATNMRMVYLQLI